MGTGSGFQAPNGKAPRFRRGADSKNGRGQLHPDATVTFAAERAAVGIDEIMAGLDRDLVGLAAVKKRVEEIASLLLLVDKARQRFGLTAPRPNLHMCFTGGPGTGKTTVALQMAELLCRLGYIESPEAEKAFRAEVERMMAEPHFANARTVRTEPELARLRHAHRIASEPHRTYARDDLTRLMPEDVLARHSGRAPARTP